MKHYSAYLDWYGQVEKAKYDFRSSGLTHFIYKLNLGDVDLSVNYTCGNPETAKLLAKRYEVKPENVFISSEGASGQNARTIRVLAERNVKKKEAIVEYPTYEPLLRQVQEHFLKVKRLERRPEESYGLDADLLRKTASRETGLLVLTNPHAPSGATSGRDELKAICDVADEYDFFVICDEIYAEFDRNSVPTVFSVAPKHGIVTTSFTKAYGLGGLKLGTALASEDIVKELYSDVLNTVGNSSNLVQLVAAELLDRCREKMEEHKQKWVRLKRQTEELLKHKGLEYFPNRVSVTYWVDLPITDTNKWINDYALPKYGLAPVPGAFFLFKNGYELAKSKMIRIGLGNINPDGPNLTMAFDALEKAIKTWPAKKR
ncbi:MAG: pyridoxal phosphate-dependent aminotransferase [Candidatus Bathyarchaeia archaeon]|jgi:aspartate/methionine/tyrosine aminotransferase